MQIGGADFAMALELLAYFHGDARTLKILIPGKSLTSSQIGKVAESP